MGRRSKVRGTRSRSRAWIGWPEFVRDCVNAAAVYESHGDDTVEYPEFPPVGKPFDMAVLDESHHALATTKHVISGGISQIRLGAMKLPITPDGIKANSTRSAAAIQGWGTSTGCWLDVFSSFLWRFAR